MTPEQHEQVKKIFLAACDLPESGRAAYLDQACGGDAELRGEVESLLRFHNPATIIEPPDAGRPADADMTLGVDRQTKATEIAGASVDSQAAPRFAAGTVIADRYRIVSLLGKGGMGEVYRAEDLKLKQTVALKFIWRGLAADSTWRDRLLGEVRLARRVTHPNVCRIHDIGEAAGEAFISMEYVDGEDLASLLKRIGRLPRDKVIQMAWQICAGLGAAHRQGVLHRDLKPANVMIDGEGNVRITDFGIAIPAEQAAKTRFAAGTLGYMAPEVLSGKPASEKSDIYALGLVLYEAVTGQPAIDLSKQAGTVFRDRPVRPSQLVGDIDPAIESTILRCLDPDPDGRPASVAAVAASLPGGDALGAALAAGEIPSAETVASVQGKGVSRKAALICLVASLAALAAIVLLADRSFLLSAASLDKAPAVLEYKARQISQELGGEQAGSGRAHGFMIDTRGLEFARERRIKTKAKGGASTAVYFEYREGERFTTLWGPLTVPEQANVHFPSENTRIVRLDPGGRLVTYISVPPRQIGDSTQSRQLPWQKAFGQAGLDMGLFREATPVRQPPVFADTNLAWATSSPDNPAPSLQVEGASVDDRIVYFHVCQPWEDKHSPDPAVPRRGSVSSAIVYGFFFSAVVAGLVLAWRNLREGRGDRTGALRVSLLMLFTAVLARIVLQPQTQDGLVHAGWMVMNLRFAVFAAATIWVSYMAAEPYVRQFWPQSLIGWSKLLAGRFRDPAVWRDVLIGTVFGIAITLLQQINALLPSREDLPAALPLLPINRYELGMLFGTRSELGVLASSLLVALWAGFLLLVIMLVLRVVLRIRWLAAIAFVAVATVVLTLTSTEMPYHVLPMALITAVGLSIILMRVGFLAGMMSLFVNLLLVSSPMTSDLKAWYAGSTVFAILVVTALLLLGVYAGRSARRFARGSAG